MLSPNNVNWYNSSAKKTIPVKATGFDQALLDQNNHLQRQTQTFTKVLDLVGPLTLQDSLQALAPPKGILCSTSKLGGIGAIDGFDPVDPVMQIPSGAYLTSFNSSQITEKQFQTLLDFIAKHQINVAPTRIFDLPHTDAAQAFLESQNSIGKVVVLP